MGCVEYYAFFRKKYSRAPRSPSSHFTVVLSLPSFVLVCDTWRSGALLNSEWGSDLFILFSLDCHLLTQLIQSGGQGDRKLVLWEIIAGIFRKPEFSTFLYFNHMNICIYRSWEWAQMQIIRLPSCWTVLLW